MKKVKICDLTLRETGKASRAELSFKEKLELAKLIDGVGADISTVRICGNRGGGAFAQPLPANTSRYGRVWTACLPCNCIFLLPEEFQLL